MMKCIKLDCWEDAAALETWKV